MWLRHDQSGSSSLVAPPSSASTFCRHFWMLDREKEGRVEGTHLLFKGMGQKLYTSLFLTSHWPELNHMITLAAREAGTCSLQPDGPVTIPGY